MHRTLIIVAALILIGVSAWSIGTHLLKPKAAESTTPNEVLREYQNASLGVSFQYREGETGYILEERPADVSESGPAHTIILTPYDEYVRLQQNPPIGGEGPAVIAINVFRNPNQQSPLAWAIANPQYSSYPLKQGTEAVTVVGAEDALAYTADGLYPASQVLIAHGSYLYVLTGQYMAPNSAIQSDFEQLLRSVVFLPSATTAGKIDSRVACESALAYMTFEDATAAEAFVTDCVNGNHPEVIERYLQELGMDGAAI